MFIPIVARPKKQVCPGVSAVKEATEACVSRNQACDTLRKDTKALQAKEGRSSLVPATKRHLYLPVRTDTCTIFLRESFLLEVKTPNGTARRWGRGRFWATQWIPFGSSRSCHPQWLPKLTEWSDNLQSLNSQSSTCHVSLNSDASNFFLWEEN